MSSYRDLLSKLGTAEALFEARDFDTAIEVFTELLRTPRFRVKAARAFLNLFSFQVGGQGLVIELPTIAEVLQLSFAALYRTKARKETEHRQEEVRTILRDRYALVLPETIKLLQVLKAPLAIATGGVEGSDKKGALRGLAGAPQIARHDPRLGGFYKIGQAASVGPHGAGEALPGAPVEPTSEAPSARKKGPPPSTGTKPASGGDEPPELIRRVPHMDLPDGVPSKAGDTFGVVVYADDQPEREGEESAEIVLEGGKDEYKLQVLLAVPPGMSVDGPDSLPLTITAAAPRSTDATFKVKVDQQVPAELPRAITAYFSYNGRPSGRVTVLIGKREGELDLPPNSIRFPLTVRPPDLTIRIIAKAINDDRQFTCIVSTPHLAKYKPRADKAGVSGDWTLKKTAPDVVNGALRRARDQGVGPRQRVAALCAAGIDLFDASPAVFQEVFWNLVDGRKPLETILIVSEEMTFPWELMIPNRKGEEDWKYPLGAVFQIGRWITRAHDAPRQALALSDAYVIAPKYIGDRELKSAPQEIQTLQACLSAALCEEIEPPDVDTIDDRLKARATTLLHFICHGETVRAGDPEALDTTDQYIVLDNDKPLSAREIRGLEGFKEACRRTHPLVFLNACEVGRPAPALLGTGGFADSFIRLDASGIIAALWGVNDTIASKVAQAFYDQLREKKRVRCAEFFRDVRKLAYDRKTGEDTYAAYCFYGDPWAEVVIGQ
ncbi:MAG: CHAT domain-containing protein [Terriglobia bacterium]|jgi:hypothetical protein